MEDINRPEQIANLTNSKENTKKYDDAVVAFMRLNQERDHKFKIMEDQSKILLNTISELTSKIENIERGLGISSQQQSQPQPSVSQITPEMTQQKEPSTNDLLAQLVKNTTPQQPKG